MNEASDREFLEKLRAEHEIKEALTRFCRGADRRDYDLLRTAFHDDAYDDHGAFSGDVNGFIAWQKQRHAKIPQSMHLIGNCTIELDGAVAFVETYCLAVIHAPSSDVEFEKTTIACRYIDRFENRAGVGWRIARRHVSYDWVTKDAVSELVPTGLSQAIRSREDQVYRLREAS